ncbi:MAG TPA: AraC family transcriptional regulator [Gemmatimonadaceae bacterium]|nr:AraC family transcriptional regulator [Gemmatimonadaceae bacterium]
MSVRPIGPAGRADIAAMHLRAAVEGAAARGVDRGRLLASVGLAADALDEPEARIPLDLSVRLWRDAAAMVGDEYFGLRTGAAAHPLRLGVLGYAIGSSPTVRAALDSAMRYEGLMYAGFTTTLRFDGDTAILRHAATDPEVGVERQPIEFALATIFAVVRHCAPVLQSARAVHFQHHAPRDVQPYRDVFGVSPMFGAAEDAVHLPGAVLDVRPAGANDEVLRTLVPIVQERHARALGDAPVTSRVRAQIIASLAHALPTLGIVARTMAMSERSVQRALRDEGTCFAELLDDVRRDAAMAHLRSTALNFSEVAFLTGFRETPSFYRAVRRWTGKTPREVRLSGV